MNKTYEKPVITTYTETEIIDIIGPAHTLTSGGPCYGHEHYGNGHGYGHDSHGNGHGYGHYKDLG